MERVARHPVRVFLFYHAVSSERRKCKFQRNGAGAISSAGSAGGAGAIGRKRPRGLSERVMSCPWAASTNSTNALHSRYQNKVLILGPRGVWFSSTVPRPKGVVAAPGLGVAQEVEQGRAVLALGADEEALAPALHVAPAHEEDPRRRPTKKTHGKRK